VAVAGDQSDVARGNRLRGGSVDSESRGRRRGDQRRGDQDQCLGNVASAVGDMATELTDRARDAAGGAADKARSASTGVVTTFGRAKRSITGEPLDPAVPEDMNRPAGSVIYKEDAYADEHR